MILDQEADFFLEFHVNIRSNQRIELLSPRKLSVTDEAFIVGQSGAGLLEWHPTNHKGSQQLEPHGSSFVPLSNTSSCHLVILSSCHLGTALRLLVCAIITSPTLDAAAQQPIARDAPEFVQAVVIQDPSKLVPESTVDLGSVFPSESLEVRVSLLNATKKEIRFNRIKRTCNCTEIAPKFGRIAPGGTIDLSIKLRTPANPTESRSGVGLNFHEDETLVLTAMLSFGFNHYVGFPSSLVTIGFGPTSLKEEFVIPIIVGSDVKHDAFVIEAEGLDVDFAYEVDRERGVLRGVLGLKQKEEFSRLYGKLTISDLDASRIQAINLILEREASVTVYPRSLRFIQPSSESRFVANVYARCANKGGERALCRATATFGDHALSCNATRLGPSVFKLELSLSEEQATSILSNDDYSQRESRHVQLTVEYGEEVVTSTAPFYFQEFRE